MGRRGSWEAAPPPPPVAALKRGAVLHGQLGLSLLFGFPIIRSTWYSNVFYVEYLFLRDERAQQDRRSTLKCTYGIVPLILRPQHGINLGHRPPSPSTHRETFRESNTSQSHSLTQQIIRW